MNDHYVVIMAGGIGSRFWPYSRNNYPKQFIDVLGMGKSLLRITYERFQKLVPSENIFVVTNDIYQDLVTEQLPEVTGDQVLLEPNRRNTAPCIAYASYKIAQRNERAQVIVTPSDHAIFNEDNFANAIRSGLEAARDDDKLITLGIEPNRPETGYGYIQYHDDYDGPVKKVKTFTEKPQLDLAQKFIESGDFVWNSGIFIWNVKAITTAFERHLPEIAEIFQNISPRYYSEDEVSSIKNAYAHCKNISIDYGVMEKANNVYVVLGDFGWSDLGSWNALYDIKEKDQQQNVVDANVLIYETQSTLIRGEKSKLIVVQGLEGYLVADCKDVLLICKKDEEHRFRQFFSDVKALKGQEFL
jgi:mannose-1-phosphate guanylyltransferase